MFINSFLVALLFKEILMIFTDTGVLSAQALQVLYLHVDNGLLHGQNRHTLAAGGAWVGFLPGHTCSLHTLAEKFHVMEYFCCAC